MSASNKQNFDQANKNVMTEKIEQFQRLKHPETFSRPESSKPRNVIFLSARSSALVKLCRRCSPLLSLTKSKKSRDNHERVCLREKRKDI